MIEAFTEGDRVMCVFSDGIAQEVTLLIVDTHDREAVVRLETGGLAVCPFSELFAPAHLVESRAISPRRRETALELARAERHASYASSGSPGDCLTKHIDAARGQLASLVEAVAAGDANLPGRHAVQRRD